MGGQDVIVVGGGIIGCASAYYLSRRDLRVTLLDQGAFSNPQASSCDHARVFSLSHGKDIFMSELAVRTLPLWKELQHSCHEELLHQNGVLELAAGDGKHEHAGLRALKEIGAPVQEFEGAAACERYRVLRRKSFRFAVQHPDGGIIWAKKAIETFVKLGGRGRIRLEEGARIVQVQRGADGIQGLRDGRGRTWRAKHYVFAAGAWTKEILGAFRVPLTVTRQECLYFRPPRNQGRYRPNHLPVFAVSKRGIWGLPVHIHGFMKLECFQKGPPVRSISLPLAPDSRFEGKVRALLKEFLPDLWDFVDVEGKVYLYTRTPDGDFILDRLPGQPNAVIAVGFSGNGPMFAPLVGQTVAELVCGEKPSVNLHRFRFGRFKR